MATYKRTQLVTHPLYGAGVVMALEPCAQFALVHFEPQTENVVETVRQADLAPGPEIPWRWERAEDIPLAWCWYRGTEHAAYNWASSSPTSMPLSEAQMDAYRRGYQFEKSRQEA